VLDLGRLLVDQERIREGDGPTDVASFTKRLSDVMTRALTGRA
jgi:hypothetical protein